MFCGSSSIVILQSVVVGVVAPLGHPCNASVWCDSSGVTQWWVEKCGVSVLWCGHTRPGGMSGQRGVWSKRCLDSRETVL